MLIPNFKISMRGDSPHISVEDENLSDRHEAAVIAQGLAHQQRRFVKMLVQVQKSRTRVLTPIACSVHSSIAAPAAARLNSQWAHSPIIQHDGFLTEPYAVEDLDFKMHVRQVPGTT
jgi:hypothetical protein